MSNSFTDISIFGGFSSTTPLEPEFANIEQVSGFQSLVNSFVLMFTSEKGTDPYDDQYGSQFMAAAKLGSILTDFDIMSNFTYTVDNIKTYLNLDNTPDAETLKSATLKSYNLGRDTITLDIILVNKENTSYNLNCKINMSFKA